MGPPVSPVWEVRHRLAVGVMCVLVALATLLAGIMQQVWERIREYDPATFEFFWQGTWIASLGLTALAAIFVVFFTIAATSFLLPSRRVATWTVLLLGGATSCVLFAIALRMVINLFFSGTRATM